MIKGLSQGSNPDKFQSSHEELHGFKAHRKRLEKEILKAGKEFVWKLWKILILHWSATMKRLSSKIPTTQKNFIFIPRLYSNHLNSALIKVHITKKLKSNELRTPFHTYCLAHNTQLLNTVSQFSVLLNTHFYCDNHMVLLHKRYKKKSVLL